MLTQYQILMLIPPVLMMIWAVVVKVRLKEWKNVFFMLVAGATLLANGGAVYLMLQEEDVPVWILLMQLILSPTVVPQAYMYFCRQMGTKGSMGVHLALWVFMLLFLVPSLSIDIHPFQEPTMCEPIKFLHFNIFNHGALVYTISIPSLIILFQALVTCVRIPAVVSSLKLYDLKFTKGGKTFILWWILAVVFCVVSSIVELETLRQPTFSWTYFVAYSAVISLVYGSIAMGMDLHPLQTTDDEEEVGNIDDFIKANRELAERAKRLFVEEKLYLRQGLVTDDVVAMLGTNRTYFTRMMRAEFKMSFNEFITSERIAYSKHLLSTSDKTLEDIAMESGFGNASAYCRVFKRLESTTPDSWRKDHRATPASEPEE